MPFISPSKWAGWKITSADGNEFRDFRRKHRRGADLVKKGLEISKSSGNILGFEWQSLTIELGGCGILGEIWMRWWANVIQFSVFLSRFEHLDKKTG